MSVHVTWNCKGAKFMCKKCGRKFASKVTLTDHEDSNCGNSPTYKCNECGKSYHSAGSLKTHSTMHTGEKPHKCQFCEKTFRTYGQVKVHERKHNGDKPFECTVSICFCKFLLIFLIRFCSAVLPASVCLSREFIDAYDNAHGNEAIRMSDVWSTFFVHIEFASTSKVAQTNVRYVANDFEANCIGDIKFD